MNRYLFFFLLLIMCQPEEEINYGILEVSSTPTGAQVYIDKENSGYTTNCTFTGVPPGEHIIELKKEGYDDYIAHVMIKEKDTTKIDVVLTEKGGRLWERFYGGEDDEEGYSIKNTDDFGYIITGYTESYPSLSSDVYLLKLDENGVKEWDKKFGTTDDEVGKDVIETDDGGYLICGYREYSEEQCDILIIKTDRNGNKEWEKIYDYGFSEKGIKGTSSGGKYVILARIEKDTVGLENGVVIKIDEKGNKIWDKIIGEDSVYNKVNDIIRAKDGAIMIIGAKKEYNKNNYDLWIVKIDENGNILWEKRYDKRLDDKGKAIISSRDNNYLIAATTYFSRNSPWIIKMDEEGNFIWDRIIETDYLNWYPCSLVETERGEIIITGYKHDEWYDEENDRWVVLDENLLFKMDEEGNIIWERKYDKNDPTCEYGRFYSSVKSTEGNFFILTGYYPVYAAEYDIWVIKIDENGRNIIK